MANELSQAGSDLEEMLEPSEDEPFGDAYQDPGGSPNPQAPPADPFQGQEPTDKGLQAELDELAAEFGPGPTPSAIRSTAEIGTRIDDEDLRRYGLGVCFGVIAGPEQLAAESGLTRQEAERMITTAEGWCSA